MNTRLRRKRHAHSYGGANAFGTTNVNVAAMEFDTAMDDEEPQPGARQLPDIPAAVECTEKAF